MENKLLCCPFCGTDAGVIAKEKQFLIVGCMNYKEPSSSMLCPNPKMVVYKDDDGEWDFQWWNRRHDQ